MPQFQNRRNRKSKKDTKALPTTPPRPTKQDFPCSPSTPPSPTRDFTLSEKKRKSYGAIGVISPSSSDSDSDGFPFNAKKTRTYRAASDDSLASATSLESDSHFTQWSSPSSRSTSSSSSSNLSAASSCFDTPTKKSNVFRITSREKCNARALQPMPSVTLEQPEPVHPQTSPFVASHVGGFAGQQGKIHFGALEMNQDVMHQDLRERVQQALYMNQFSQTTEGQGEWVEQQQRSVSVGSQQQNTTDDDGWEDVDEAPIQPQPVATIFHEGHQQPQAQVSTALMPWQQPQSNPNMTTVADLSLGDAWNFDALFQNPTFAVHQQQPLINSAPVEQSLDVDMTYADFENFLSLPLPGEQLEQNMQVSQGEHAAAEYSFDWDLTPNMLSLSQQSQQ